MRKEWPTGPVNLSKSNGFDSGDYDILNLRITNSGSSNGVAKLWDPTRAFGREIIQSAFEEQSLTGTTSLKSIFRHEVDGSVWFFYLDTATTTMSVSTFDNNNLYRNSSTGALGNSVGVIDTIYNPAFTTNLYLICSDGKIRTLSTSTLQITAVTGVILSLNPIKATYNPSTDEIWVTNTGAGTEIDRVDATALTLSSSLALSGAFDILYVPSTDEIWVTNFATNRLAFYDATTAVGGLGPLLTSPTHSGLLFSNIKSGFVWTTDQSTKFGQKWNLSTQTRTGDIVGDPNGSAGGVMSLAIDNSGFVWWFSNLTFGQAVYVGDGYGTQRSRNSAIFATISEAKLDSMKLNGSGDISLGTLNGFSLFRYADASSSDGDITINVNGTASFAGSFANERNNPSEVVMIKVITEDPDQSFIPIKYLLQSMFGKVVERLIPIISFTNTSRDRNQDVIDIPLPTPLVLDARHGFEWEIIANSSVNILFYFKQKTIAKMVLGPHELQDNSDMD